MKSTRLDATLRDLETAGATVVSLEGNPLDFRPVRKAVLRKVNGRMEESAKSQVVVYLEDHRVLEHVLLPLIHISHAGKSRGKHPRVILEIPQNIPSILYRNFETEFKRHGVAANDVFGIMERVNYFFRACSVTNALLLSTCQKYRFPTVLSDTSVTDCGKYIDLARDERVHWLKEQFDIADEKEIPRCSDLGMLVRNECIAESVIAEVKKQKVPRTVILRVGAEHAFGHAKDSSYPISLAALFHEAGLDMTYVMPMGKGFSRGFFPWRSIFHAQDMVLVNGHSEQRFTFRKCEEEAEHLTKVLQQSGYKIAAAPN